MSIRLTSYSLKSTGLRQLSGSTPGCSADLVSEVQKAGSLPINRVQPLRLKNSETRLNGDIFDLLNEDAPGYWPYILVGSTDQADDDAGWTEVVIPGGLPVLGNLYGCLTTTIIYSSCDCTSYAPKIGLDRKDFFGACHQDNCIKRSTAISDMSEISCPTNNEVT
jgi:hypothetical protein